MSSILGERRDLEHVVERAALEPGGAGAEVGPGLGEGAPRGGGEVVDLGGERDRRHRAQRPQQARGRGRVVGAALDQAVDRGGPVDPGRDLQLGDGERAVVAQLVEPRGRRGVVVDVPAQRGARDVDVDAARGGEGGLPGRAGVVGVGQAERGAEQRPAHGGGEPQGVGVADRGDQRRQRRAGGHQGDAGARRVVACGARAADRHDAGDRRSGAPRLDDVGQPRAEVIGVDQHDVGRAGAGRPACAASQVAVSPARPSCPRAER